MEPSGQHLVGKRPSSVIGFALFYIHHSIVVLLAGDTVTQCDRPHKCVFVLSVLGKIRSAIGSAQLLMSQKFLQFRELCEENLVSVLKSLRETLMLSLLY